MALTNRQKKKLGMKLDEIDEIRAELKYIRKAFNIFALLSALTGIFIGLSDEILTFFKGHPYLSTNYDPAFGIIQKICVGLCIVASFAFLILGRRK